jgi:hypothetical protein
MQRGNAGIDSFDSSSLKQRPTPQAPAVFHLV